jgi:hypothetical protein
MPAPRQAPPGQAPPGHDAARAREGEHPGGRRGRDTRQLHRATPAKVNRMLLVPGGNHGVQLLSDATGSRVRAAIFAFLRANAG